MSKEKELPESDRKTNPDAGNTDPAETRNIEDIFQELETILSGMQDPEVTLEESFRLYEKGMKDIRSCSEQLDQIEKKMQVLTKDGSLEPFDAE